MGLEGRFGWGYPMKAKLQWRNPWGNNLGRHQFWAFPVLLPPSIKHQCHPLGCHVSPPSSCAQGGRHRHSPKSQASPCPRSRVWISLPREDSEAEEDWLTLKAMSESLSSWEPLRDPDGDGIAGPDCRVPETKETPSGGRCSAGPQLCAALRLIPPHPPALGKGLALLGA